ncbi:F-box protein [Quillaja saponaria]|uniref:F-box protein n=1 Tax=Quillaja saponaria TaxID=32244 RepID=A0AAD7P8Y0_QUISA|nr:F-box protein [Quillaja saponaria]
MAKSPRINRRLRRSPLLGQLNSRRIHHLITSRYVHPPKNLPISIITHKKQEQFLGFRFWDLPSEIRSDILSRLPVWSIFCCRCVSKAFRNSVTNSLFIQLFIQRPPPTSFIILSDLQNLFQIDSCDAPSIHISSAARGLLENYTGRWVKLGCSTKLVNSCNGFVCLYNFRRVIIPKVHQYWVCNPVLGEFVLIPPLPSTDHDYQIAYYFGFSPKTKEYKILHLGLGLGLGSAKSRMAWVYTIGKNSSWKVIEDVPSSDPRRPNFDPFLNGSVHWISNSSASSELIYSFDFDKDEFQPVPPPIHLDVKYMNKISWINVLVLKGCLCLCYVFEGNVFEAWVMNEYGKKESWAKRFTIDIKFYCGLELSDHKQKPIGFTNCGDMALQDCPSGSLFCYSPEKKGFKEININGISSNFQVVPHSPSFASLRDVIQGTQLKVEIIHASTQTP